MTQHMNKIAVEDDERTLTELLVQPFTPVQWMATVRKYLPQP